MTEVTGIDHIYIAVSDLERSEVFYDQVLLGALNFRKNKSFARTNSRWEETFTSNTTTVILVVPST